MSLSFPDPVSDSQFYHGVRARRVAAFFVDLLVIVVLLIGVIMIGAVVGVITAGIGFVLLIPAIAVTGLVYRTTMVMERSATLGMMLMGIELRDARGSRLDGSTAFIHALAFTATLYLPPVLIASVGWAAINPRGQTIPDALCQTVMINRPED
ncbi:MAG: RDD family protein [Pseudomonadota bacterium]